MAGQQADTTIKNLKVVIEVDAKKAQAEAIAFSNFLTQRFMQAGQRAAKAMGFGDLSGLKKQLGDVATTIEKTVAKPIPVTAAVDTQGIKQTIQSAGKVLEEETKKATAKAATVAKETTKAATGTPTGQGAFRAPYPIWDKQTKSFMGAPGALTEQEKFLKAQEVHLGKLRQEFGLTAMGAKNFAKDLSYALGMFQNEKIRNVLGIKGAIDDFTKLQTVSRNATKTLEAIKHMPSLQKTIGLTEEQMEGLRILSSYDASKAISSAKKATTDIQKIQKMSVDEFDKFQDEQSVNDAKRYEERTTRAKKFYDETIRAADHATELDKERVKPIFQETAERQKLAKSYDAIAAKAQQLGVITEQQAKSGAYQTDQLRHMIAEHLRYGRAVEATANKMGVQKDILLQQAKAADMSAGKIKEMGKAYGTVTRALAAMGEKALNKEIRDILSGVTVKGQGGVLGRPRGLEEAVLLLKEEGARLPIINEQLTKHGIIMNELHNPVRKLAESAKNYMKFQMGWFAGASVLMGIVGSVTSLAKASLEYEQTLKNILAITDLTVEEVRAFGEVAIKTSMETALSAVEILKLGQQLVRAGLSAKEAAAAMSVASKVAVISGEDVKVVADTMATAIMAWRIPAREMETLGNTIAAALNYSRLTVQDLGVAFNYMAGVATTFNRSFAETNAILAVYSNLGVKASTIATGWVQLMSEFIAPSKKAKDYLHLLKISLEEINPEAHSFADILETLEKHGFAASKSLDIFQVRAGRALMFALRATSKEFREMEERIRKTKELSVALAEAQSGPINALKTLWNTVQASAIAIGSALTPVIVYATKGFQFLASILYHFLHLMSTAPGKIIVVVAALALLRKELVKLQATIVAFLTGGIGSGLLKIAMVIGAGAAIDKMLGGDDAISKLQKMKKEVDDNQAALRKLGQQFGYAGDHAESATGQVDSFQRELQELKMVDVSSAMSVFDKYAPKIVQLKQEAEKLKNVFRDTKILLDNEPKEEGWFWKLMHWMEDKSGIGFIDTVKDKLKDLQKFMDWAYEPEMGLNLPPTKSTTPPITTPGGLPPELQTESWKQYWSGYWSKYEEGRRKAAIKEEEALKLTRKATQESIAEVKKMAAIKAAYLKEGLSVVEIDALVIKHMEEALRQFGADEMKFMQKRDEILTSAAAAYLEAYQKRTKGAEDPYDLERTLYKEHLQELEIRQRGELNQLQHHNEMKDLAEKEYTARLEADWNERLWVLDTFYKEGLSDAESYYAEKKRIMTEQSEWERARIRSDTERQLSEMQQRASAMQETMRDQTNRMAVILEDILKQVGKEEGFAIYDLIMGGDKAAVTKKVEELKRAGRDITEALVKDYMDTANKVRELQTSLDDLLNSMKKVEQEGVIKITEAELKHAEALRKLNYEMQIAVGLLDLQRREFSLKHQIEVNKLLSDAAELTGNWNEVERLRLRLLRDEGEATRIKNQMDIRRLEVEMEVARQAGKDITVHRILIELLREEYAAFAKLQAAKESYETRKQEQPFLAGMEDAVKAWGTYNEQIYEIGRDTVNSLRQTWSDGFFDWIVGEWKGLGEYIKNWSRDILRMITDMWSKQLFAGMFGKTQEDVPGLGGLFRGIGELVGGIFRGPKEKPGAGGAPTPPGWYAPLLLPEFEAGADMFSGVFEAAGAAEGERQTNFLGSVGSVFDKLLGGMGGLFETLLGGLGDIIGKIASAIGQFVGGLFHRGGLVRHLGGPIPYNPRSGLAVNERLTINKVGERYITREQNEWLTNIAKVFSYSISENDRSRKMLQDLIEGQRRGVEGAFTDTSPRMATPLVSRKTQTQKTNLSIVVPITVPFDNHKMMSELRREVEDGLEQKVTKVIRKYS